MAATQAETATLVKRLRGKGLSDAQISDSLTQLGYSRSAATAAVGGDAAAGTRPPAAATGGSGGETPSPAAPAPSGSTNEEPDTGNGEENGGGTSGLRLPSFEVPSPTLTPPRKLDGGDLAGFAFGVLLYCLVLNYLRYGTPGVTGWFKAKFLNSPLDPGELQAEAEGSSPQGPTVGGSDALGQLLLEPMSGTAPSATTTPATGLTSTKAATPTNV